MKFIEKIRYFFVAVFFSFGFLQAINTSLFPQPQRGMVLNTAGIILRESMRKKDVAATRQALSTLRYLLDVSWEELLRRLADGELNPEMKITENAQNKKQLQKDFYNIANISAAKVAGTIVQAEMLKKQVERLERQVVEKEEQLTKLQKGIEDIRKRSNKQKADFSQLKRRLEATSEQIKLREKEIDRLQQDQTNLQARSLQDLALIRQQAADDLRAVRSVLKTLVQQKAQVEKERDNLNRDIRLLKGFLGSLELDLKLAERSKSLSDAELKEITEDKEKLKQTLEDQVRELEKKEQDLQFAEDTINTQQNTLNLLNTGNISLIDEKDQLALEKQDLEERLKARESAWNDAAKELDDKISELEKQVLDQKQETITLRGENFGYFQQILGLSAEIDDQQVALNSFDENINDLKDTKLLNEEALKKQKALIKGQKTRLERQIRTIKKLGVELQSTLKERDQFKQINARLSSELASAKENISTLTEKVKKAEALSKKFKKEKVTADKTMQERLREIGDWRLKFNDLETESDEFKEKSKKDLEDAEAELVRLREANEKLEDENLEVKKVFEEELEEKEKVFNLLKDDFEKVKNQTIDLQEIQKTLEKENTELKMLINDLVEEAQGLDEDLKTAKKEIEDQKNSLDELQEKLEKTEQGKKKLETELAGRAVEIEKYTNEIADYMVNVFGLELSVEQLQNDLNKSEKRYKEQLNLIKELKEENLVTEATRNDVIDVLDTREKEIKDLKKLQNELLQKILEKNNYIVELEQKFALSQDREKALEERLKLQKLVFIEKQKSLQQAFDALKNRFDAKVTALKSSEETNKTLLESIETLEETKKNLLELLNVQSIQIDEYKREKLSNEKDISSYQEQLKKNKKALEDTAAKLKNLYTEYGKIAGEKNLLQLKNQQLEKEAQDLNETILNLLQDKKNLQTSLDKINSELQKQGSSLIEQIKENIALKNDLQKNRIDFAKKLREGESQKADLNKKIEELQTDADINKDALAEAKKDIQKLQEDQKSYDELLRLSYEVAKGFEDKNTLLTKQLEKAREKVEKLTRELESKQLEVSKLNSLLAEEQKRFADSQKDLKQNISELKNQTKIQVKTIKNFENQIQQLKKNQNDSKKKIKEQEITVKRMQLELKKAAQESEEKTQTQDAQIKKLQQQLDADKNILEAQKTEIEERKKEVATLAQEKLDLNEKLNLLTLNKTELSEKITEISEQKEKVESANKNLTSTVEKLESSQSDLESQITAAKKQVEEVQQSNQTLFFNLQLSKEALEEQGKQLKNLKESSDAADEEKQNEISKLEKTILEQNDKIVEQETSLNKFMGESSKNSIKIAELAGNLAAEKIKKAAAEGRERLLLESLQPLENSTTELRARLLVRDEDLKEALASEAKQQENISKKILELALKLDILIELAQSLTSEQLDKLQLESKSGESTPFDQQVAQFKTDLNGLEKASGFMASPGSLVSSKNQDILPVYFAMKDNLNFFNGFVRGFGFVKNAL